MTKPLRWQATAKYTAAERELFHSYREHREPFRPKACMATENCWVEVGPPAMNSQFKCAACGGSPRAAIL